MFKVEYSIIGYGEFFAGPYKTMSLAQEHEADIKGYEGVEWTKIVPMSTVDAVNFDLAKAFDKRV